MTNYLSQCNINEILELYIWSMIGRDPLILVVDDEEDIVDIVSFNLEKEGFRTITANDGEKALEICWDEDIDLVVLDIMLPGINGLDVLKTLRDDTRTEATPVILLTAKTTEIDKIVGFQLGTDDYVCKPFSVKELVVRTKAILKRSHGYDKEKRIATENLFVDFNKHKFRVNNTKKELSPKEFAILYYLHKNRHIYLSKCLDL